MKNIKKGDIVARKSYGKDILFKIKRIIKYNNMEIAILTGLIERVEADSNIEDLERIETKEVRENLVRFKNRINKRIQENINNKKHNRKTGKILHLDGECKNVY